MARIPKATVTVELGKKYRDKVSGYEGVATAVTEFLYACRRVTLDSFAEGEVKQFSFDEPQLEAVEAPQIERPRLSRTGGDRAMPSQRKSAAR